MVASKDTLNPTPVGGWVFSTPYYKIAITPKINDPCEPTFGDFSYYLHANLIYDKHLRDLLDPKTGPKYIQYGFAAFLSLKVL